MRVLFVHDECPGQFANLAAALADDPANRVVFLARSFPSRPRGVECVRWRRRRLPSPGSHPYLLPLDAAVSAGEAAFEQCATLRRNGFRPDVIVAHAGFGPGLYLKEVYPDVPLLGYFEWLYRGPARDSEYLTGEPVADDVACRARTRNAGILLELATCDAALTPTRFQRAQFPPPLHDKLRVLHDGVDTRFYRPRETGSANMWRDRLPDGALLLTYATRGMEPMRGFPQFMRAVAPLLERIPELHVLIAGEDRAVYSPRLGNGRSYREQALAENPALDCARVQFLGTLARDHYRELLRASDLHVYLTAPFVLSWSLLEAMSCGCLLVAADTPPVAEVIDDGVEGLLVDFREPRRLTETLADALRRRAVLGGLRAAARRRIERDYALEKMLPRQLALIDTLRARRSSGDGPITDFGLQPQPGEHPANGRARARNPYPNAPARREPAAAPARG